GPMWPGSGPWMSAGRAHVDPNLSDELAEAAAGRPASAVDRAVEALRQAIMSGKLAGGERLSQESVAAALKMSRTPVREALQRLERDGLVSVEGRRGLVVARVTDADL